MRIAILQADLSQAELLIQWLQLAGHHPRRFENGARLLWALERESFDALLLDWDVPDMNGVEVLKRARQRTCSSVPALFVSAHNREDDVVTALRGGADDYMVTPVRRLELIARVEALPRRGRHLSNRGDVLEVGVFRFDFRSRTVSRDGHVLELTAKEFELSALLLCNAGRLLSRNHIRENVWCATAVITTRTLDTHISRIRKKLGFTPEHGWRLAAVYGYGYRLDQIELASRVRARGSESRTVAGLGAEPARGPLAGALAPKAESGTLLTTGVR
jgi:DNA-binding response OmpR family regulator